MWKMTLTDGTESELTVLNGPEGPQGPAGNVHYGEQYPADSNAVIWINPGGEASPTEQILAAKDTAVDAATNASSSASSASSSASSASTSASSASASASSASESALDAEAWAVGTRDGSDISSSDPAYNNYSKYWALAAGESAEDSDDSAEDSEAYAIGKRDGVDVSSDDPAYLNNAKYYAAQAVNSETAAEYAQSAAEVAQAAAQVVQFRPIHSWQPITPSTTLILRQTAQRRRRKVRRRLLQTIHFPLPVERLMLRLSVYSVTPLFVKLQLPQMSGLPEPTTHRLVPLLRLPLALEHHILVMR